MPKFCASMFDAEVTTFQAMRPALRWSIEASMRAMWNGW